MYPDLSSGMHRQANYLQWHEYFLRYIAHAHTLEMRGRSDIARLSSTVQQTIMMPMKQIPRGHTSRLFMFVSHDPIFRSYTALRTCTLLPSMGEHFRHVRPKLNRRLQCNPASPVGSAPAPAPPLHECSIRAFLRNYNRDRSILCREL